MSRYQSLVGQCFSRNGATFTIDRCEGGTVLASMLHRGAMEPVLLPLADVLEALELEVPEITMTELPRPRNDVSHA